MNYVSVIQWRIQKISEGMAIILKNRFSKPIRGSITRILPFLWRKKEKKKISDGVAIVESPNTGSATGLIPWMITSTVGTGVLPYFVVVHHPVLEAVSLDLVYRGGTGSVSNRTEPTSIRFGSIRKKY